MQNCRLKRLFAVLIISVGFIQDSYSQTTVPRDSADYRILRASSNYNKNPLYKFFWGEHHRKEWNTPVKVKSVGLDTLKGGLIPYGVGGSRQTKSIRAKDPENREYVFRRVDKSFGKAIPEITHGTFIEKLANDQVTISHPYAALVVEPLARAIKIFHAIPELVYVPKQNALGSLSDSTGNILYALEQRPDEDWSTAPNFGYSKKIVGTDKMLEKTLSDNDNSVDQKAFVKARLFDMFVGDWGRHEDQWRWATFQENGRTVYVPIPRDRDNAFTKFDGVALKFFLSAAKAKHMQTFDYKIKDVNNFNFPARHLDHHLVNEVTKEEWLAIANEMKSSLTDVIIDGAVKQLPPEVYPVSGPEIAAKLKARRELLPVWASAYFTFLNKEVEITGTQDSELFEVNRISDTETVLDIYKITEEREIKSKPYFHRVFKNNETEEIRLYGIAGNDEYRLKGKVNNGIFMRLIGGSDKDSYADESTVKGNSRKTYIYDNPGNDIKNKTAETKLITSSDSSINKYDYEFFNYSKSGIRPMLFYNREDRIYTGFAFKKVVQKWRKPVKAVTHYADVKYSINQNAISTTYYSDFLEALGKWNLRTYANYDAVRWTNFYGLGNETPRTTNDRDYNRIRSEEFTGRIKTDRIMNNRFRYFFGINSTTYRIINDTGRFLIKQSGINAPAQNKNELYGGAETGFVYQNLNDSVLPTKGFAFLMSGSFTDNLRKRSNTVGNYGAEANIFLPLGKKFGLMVRGGAASLSGDPEFYQYNMIGGTQTLRGYRRERFYGNSTAFNQNELRFITNVRSNLFNGKFGIFALYDAGRVWLKGENSNRWHTGYGGGIIISPFNKIAFSAAYAVSPEDKNIHFSVIRPL